MRLPSRIGSAALCLLASGCMGAGWTRDDASEARIANARPDASARELQERLAAGHSIQSQRQREASFTVIALDAAASGQPDACVEALDQISVLRARDRVAADCAVLAIERGELDDAQEIAKIIRSIRTRDAVFGEIARGKRGKSAGR